MTTLGDYLEEKAKFLSPPVTEDESKSTRLTDLNPLEVDRLHKQWKPTAARLDDQMVNSLLAMLTQYTQHKPLVTPNRYDSFFTPLVDEYGELPGWQEINDEFAARNMVQRLLDALFLVLRDLGIRTTMRHQMTPPDPDFASKVDFTLYRTDFEGKRVLVEAESPRDMNALLSYLFESGRKTFRVDMRMRKPVGERVFAMMCHYMASYRARWGVITSHEKWVFIRLYPGADPYVTFSPVELQADSTRTFRALLAMMLAAELDLEVSSHADLQEPLPPITEGEDSFQDPLCSDLGEGKVGTSERNKRTTEDPPATQPNSRDGRRYLAEKSDLLIGWSRQEVENPTLYSFVNLGYTDPSLALGPACPRLSLHRLLGRGSTGSVYQARLGDDDICENSRSYAVKIVVKSKCEEKKGCLQRLRNEFGVYCKVAQAERDEQISTDVTPNCYGLYESEDMIALILSYEGEALTSGSWSSLSFTDRNQIFESLSALHKVGIMHLDFEPRNIVRDCAGLLKVIDFSTASFHNCPGIKEVPWGKASRRECDELKYVHRELLGPHVNEQHI